MTPDARLPFGLLCLVCVILVGIGLGAAWSAGLWLVGVLYVLIGGGTLWFFWSIGREWP